MMLVFTSVCIFSGTMVAIRILNRNARSTGSQNRIDIRCFKLGLDVKHQYFSMAQTEMTASVSEHGRRTSPQFTVLAIAVRCGQCLAARVPQ